MTDLAWIPQLILAISAVALLVVVAKPLRSLLLRPDVSVEVAGFKLSASGRARVVEKLGAAQAAKSEFGDGGATRDEGDHLADAVEDLGRPARILWIDDAPSNNLLEHAALDRARAAVDLAIDWDQAETKLRLFGPYDLIISDMQRDEARLLSAEYLEGLRADGDQTPLIFYTVYAHENADEYFDDAVAAGAQGCASEPLELFELVARGLRVAAAIDRPGRRRAKRAWRAWRKRTPARVLKLDE